MKKLMLLLSAVTLVFASCSEESNSPSDNTSVVLPKKIIDTYVDESVITSTITYDGTKLVKITDDDNMAIFFTYTGNQITKMEYKTGTIVDQIDTFTYNDAGNVASYTRVEPIDDLGSKEVYTYNSDGTITISTFSGDALSQTNQGGTGLISFTNGEISQIVTGDGTVHTYTYDAKNNPFKNVTGYDQISFADSSASGILHNILVQTTSTDSDVVNTYTYLANDFPATATELYDGETTVSQFFYD